MNNLSAQELAVVIIGKGYQVFSDDSLNLNMNLIGIRSDHPVFNKFNDILYVIWKFNGEWNLKQFSITTLPGKYYEETPMSPDGCAIMVPGQYPGMWAIGAHFDQTALIQVRECQVYRDKNKDDNFDMDPATIQIGNFRIDCHRKNLIGLSETVDLGSAGCQVHADGLRFENEFMPLMKQASAIHGNSFTYTLLKESDLT